MIPFGPLVFQCAVDPVDHVTAINAFVLCDALLFEFGDEALEDGAATRDQPGGTFWYLWVSITHVWLPCACTKPSGGPDIVFND